MTVSEAKNNLVAWCNGQVGYAEGPNNYNKFAPKWTAAGGWNAQNQPWCDIFVDCAFIECFGVDMASKLTYQPKGGFSALCSTSANYYKANGAWFSTPNIGDQVFFYSGGGINHTGIVVDAAGGLVVCVEGNSSDAVRRNTYRLGDGYIAGFGRPNWAVVSASNTQAPVSAPTTAPQEPAKVVKCCTISVKLPVIEYGDDSMWVKLMQTALIGRGFNCGWYGADGEYGPQTKIALFQFQKKMYEADPSFGAPDYICGQKTWTKLLEVV